MNGSRSTYILGIIFSCAISILGQTHSAPMTGMSTEATKLEIGTPVERSMSGGERHLYKIELSENQFIKVEASQTNCDIILALDSPTKAALFEFKDDNFRNGSEVQTAAVQTAGTYILKVVSFEKATQKGSYALKISEIRPATDKEMSQTAALEIVSKLSKIEKGGLTAQENRELMNQYEDALQKFRFAGNKKWEAIAISSIGSIYVRLGQTKKSIELHRQALDIQKSIGADKEVVFLLTNLGNTYLHENEPQKALEILTEAASLVSLKGDAYNESIVLDSIGRVYEDSGDSVRAMDFYKRAIEKAQTAGQGSRIATSLNSIGMLSSSQGQGAEAVSYFAQALDITRRTTNRRLEAATLANMASAFVSAGDLSKADASLSEALAITREVTDKAMEASILSRIASIRMKNGMTDEAIELLTQSREMFRSVENSRNLAETLLMLAKAKAKKRDLSSAQDDAAAAIELIEKLRGNFKTVDLRDSFSVQLQEFYSFYIEILMEIHKLEPEKNYAALAFQASERARARGFIDLLAESNAEIRQGVDPKLLQKETEIRQLLSARLENLTKVLNGKVKPETADALKNEVESIKAEYETVQKQIRDSSPRYAALTQPKTLSLQEIQADVLDADSVLLEYSLGKTKSFLWVVTKTGFKAIELPAAQSIENVSRQYYESLTARNKEIKFETDAERDARIQRADGDTRRVSQELSKLLLGPAAEMLANKKLLLVADGALRYVPFSALASPNATVNKQQFLAESHEIVNLPSASALAVLRNETAGRAKPAKTLGVLADPIFDKKDERFQAAANRNKQLQKPASSDALLAQVKRQTRSAGDLMSRDGLDLTRLPFTRREADLITSVVPNGQKEKWLDFDANRQLATSSQLSNYRYVHFATHGFINDRNPELSGLVFSTVDEKGNDRDGFLRVGDIYNLKLPSEMVVLSGCKTGLGKEIKGEGVVGMTRAFMYAGAKRVTFSLWDINDEATSELMGHLYREMFAAKTSTPSAALRKAQISMIKDKRWSNPYFWATFVMQGEPR